MKSIPGRVASLPSRPSLPRSIAFALSAAAIAGGVQAQNKSWLIGNGQWGTAANWSPLGVPGFGNHVLLGDLPQVKNSWVTLNQGTLINGLTITDGMTLWGLNGQLVVGGPTLLSGKNVVGNGIYHSQVIVADGPASPDAAFGTVTIEDEGRLRLDDGHAALAGVLSVGPESIVQGSGVIDLHSNAPTAMSLGGRIIAQVGGLAVNQLGAGLIDLDAGPPQSVAVRATAASIDGDRFATITIDGTAIAGAVNREIQLGRGNELTMNLAQPWTLGPLGELRILGSPYGGPVTRVNGAPLVVHGRIDAAFGSSELRFFAPTTMMPSSSLDVAPNASVGFTAPATVVGGAFTLGIGAEVDFDGPTTLHGGHITTHSGSSADGRVAFKGPTTWAGGTLVIDGAARQIGNATVTGPTTIIADRFDMDGIPSDHATWTLHAPLTVSAGAIDDGNVVFRGTMNISGAALGKLTIELTGPTPHWLLGLPGEGVANLGGVGALMTTRIDGSPVSASSAVNVSGRVRFGSESDWRDTAAINFQQPTARLRLAGSSTLDRPTVSGGGRIEGEAGGMLTVAGATMLESTDLSLAGGFTLGLPTPAGTDTVGVTIVRNAIFAPTATWRVAIGGPIPGAAHDVLIATGPQSTLAGELDVRLIDLGAGVYLPSIGDSFVVLEAPSGSTSGALPAHPISHAPNNSVIWSVAGESDAAGDRVRLTVVNIVPCPGDLNADGSVDGADLALLLAAWGPCATCVADLNNDGIVDSADVGILFGAWGGCPLP
ncbi:MAG TPA: hypothetical protein PKC43_13775 [Phycisphaerales bacterium]|nr:hypothetical protein [Phycisphaerales bacterium]HMP38502.1 hypothetical protein [Phycisphaerales bacterium]